jgi:hypothetical protein
MGRADGNGSILVGLGHGEAQAGRCGINCLRWWCAILLALTATARGGNTGTDPTNKCAWAENVGWANTAPTNVAQTVVVHYNEATGGWLSGYAWGENIGWVAMGSASGGPYGNTTAANWGMNLAANGDLSGYAWGENVGWINFGHALCDAAINPTNGEFSGHAWGENIGWITFRGSSPAYGVRTLAFDTQPQGTPNWWLDHHQVAETHDAGDGVPAWRKYVMDTDPLVAGDYLHISAVTCTSATTTVSFAPTSTRRYYTLTRRSALTTGVWDNVEGQISVQGSGTGQALQDTPVSARAFYSVKVRVAP